MTMEAVLLEGRDPVIDTDSLFILIAAVTAFIGQLLSIFMGTSLGNSII